MSNYESILKNTSVYHFSFKQRQRNIHRNHDYSGLFVLHAIVSITPQHGYLVTFLPETKRNVPKKDIFCHAPGDGQNFWSTVS